MTVRFPFALYWEQIGPLIKGQSTNVIGKKSIYPRRKSGNGAKSRQKRSFKGWFAEFVLTRKKACAHEKKGFTSREKRFHLTSANSPLGFSPVHWLCSCARFRDFCLLIQALSALKDQPLGGCLGIKRILVDVSY